MIFFPFLPEFFHKFLMIFFSRNEGIISECLLRISPRHSSWHLSRHASRHSYKNSFRNFYNGIPPEKVQEFLKNLHISFSHSWDHFRQSSSNFFKKSFVLSGTLCIFFYKRTYENIIWEISECWRNFSVNFRENSWKNFRSNFCRIFNQDEFLIISMEEL